MGYQAPIVLLGAVAFLVLAYSWFGWRQKSLNFNCPCLTLLLSNQDNFLEGLLRQFLSWCYWHGTPWRLKIIAYSPAKVTLAILRHFFYLYPLYLEVSAGEDIPLPVSPEPCQQDDTYLVDLREEGGLNAAWGWIYKRYLKNNL